MKFRTLILALVIVGGFVYFTAKPNSLLRRGAISPVTALFGASRWRHAIGRPRLRRSQ